MRFSQSAQAVLDAAGPTVSIPEAGQVLGVSRWTAYDLAKRDELGVRILRVGSRLRVPTAELRRLVGVDDTPQPA